MALTENSRKVYDFVKAAQEAGDKITAQDIADGTGLTTKQVNGSVTAAFQKKELMERVESVIEVEEGKHKTVKFIRLTEKGMAFDPDATEEKAE